MFRKLLSTASPLGLSRIDEFGRYRSPSICFETIDPEVMAEIGREVKALGDNTRALGESVKKRMDAVEARIGRIGFGAGTGGPFGTDDEHKEFASGAPPEEQKTLRDFIRNGGKAILLETKAASVDYDPSGGFLVSPALARTINSVLFNSSPIRQLSRVITLTTGDAWEEPWDHEDAEAVWAGERETREETDTGDQAMLRIPLAEVYALANATAKLIDTSSFDIVGWLSGKIGSRFARSEGTAFVTGDGVKRPRGILTYPHSTDPDASREWGSLQTVASGASGDITADALIDMTFTLGAGYRGGASWVMNSNAAAKVAKLKDQNDRYLLSTSLAAGVPSSLLGYPLRVSEDLPDVVSGSLSIAFGDFARGYTVVDGANSRLLIDPYSSKPKILVYDYRRIGGGVSDFNAIKLMLTA